MATPQVSISRGATARSHRLAGAWRRCAGPSTMRTPARSPRQLLAPAGASLTADQVAGLLRRACPPENYRGQRVCLIIPDATRTAPVGLMFKTLHTQLAGVTAQFDVMIALGTHPPMSDAAINERVEITAAERATAYARV